jgi:uncharacterized protein YcbK (DUF882 family)
LRKNSLPRFIGIGVLLFFSVFYFDLSTADETKPKERYFLSGDGWIQLSNAKTGQSARIQYRLADGSYPREAHQQVNRLFGVPASSDDEISLRLVSLLDYLEDLYRHPIEIISGYRSPEYNEGLRAKGRLAAKASLHIEGMAADIRMRKVLSAEAFETIKTLNCCGVGFYHDNSLHVDTGPARYWDETTSKVRTNISEHNKRIMVRTDQDIYLPGEEVELQLARITDYPLGFASGFAIVQNEQIVREFSFDGKNETCVPVKDPGERTTRWTIPSEFRPQGKVRVRLRFCNKPFSEMPDQIESNPIVIHTIGG